MAVLYESSVRVLSDAEKRDEEMGTSSSDIDRISVRAAQDFTSRFDELSAKYPKFQKLTGVFDVTKLCNAWRSLGVKPAGLEANIRRLPGGVNCLSGDRQPLSRQRIASRFFQSREIGLTICLRHKSKHPCESAEVLRRRERPCRRPC